MADSVTEVGGNAAERANFWRWAGPDGSALLDRARAGETRARRELERRWYARAELDNEGRLSPEDYLVLLREWFRDYHPRGRRDQRILRAIRRNRHRVPKPSDLAWVLRRYRPLWDATRLALAHGHLSAGPRQTQLQRFPSSLLEDRRVGRPPAVGLSESERTAGLHVLTGMIRSLRRGRVMHLEGAAIAAVFGVGVPLTVRGELLRLEVPKGEARKETGEPLWLALPWQRFLFWIAVGQAPPGLAFLKPAEPLRRRGKAEGAADDFLNAVWGRAGFGWQPRRRRPMTVGTDDEVHKWEEAVRALREHYRAGGTPDTLPEWVIQAMTMGDTGNDQGIRSLGMSR